MRSPILPILFVPLAVPSVAPPARAAEPEAWIWLETRVPLVDRLPLTDRPVQLRLFSDLRLGQRYGGLGWQIMRAGPLWHLGQGFFVGTHLAFISNQSSPGNWDQEYRVDIEPNFSGRLGDWLWSDRHRLEWRVRVGAGTQHPRYRNLLRMQYAPAGLAWQPFAWLEPLFDFNAEGFAANPLGLAQNRVAVGVARPLGSDARVDLALLLRSRFGAGTWAHDPIANVTLFFAPGSTPILHAEPAGE